MPDGDRFMRQLIGTGRGWGKAYSLACNDSPYLFDQVIKACADNFRRFSDGAIQGAVNVLTAAFERQSWSDKDNLMSSAEVFLKLKEEYRQLKVDGDYDLVGVLERTVESVFNIYKNDSRAMNRSRVAEELGSNLASNIMDSRFLSRVRNGLIEKSNRDFSEQLKWEQDLRMKVSPAAKKMVINAFKGEKVKIFRAPASKQKKRSTSDILSKGLKVLLPN